MGSGSSPIFFIIFFSFGYFGINFPPALLSFFLNVFLYFMDNFSTKLIDHIFKSETDKYKVFLNAFGQIDLPLLTHKLFPKAIIYRARESSPDEVMENFSDFSYPPPTDSYSRIGKPGDVWFYASEHFDACLAELLPTWKGEEGEYLRVTFGIWELKEVLNVLIIPDLENENQYTKEAKLNDQLSASDKEFWRLVCPYFFQSQEENPEIYLLTSALVTALMEQAEKGKLSIDGIMYPCVENKEKTNIALLPHTIDENKIAFKRAEDMLFNQSGEAQGDFPGFEGPKQKREGWLVPESCKIKWAM